MPKSKQPPQRTSEEICAATQYTLLTNISFVQLRDPGVRLECKALLIEEGTLGFGQEVGYRLRGFGVDPAWPVFTMWLDNKKQLPFEISGRARDNSITVVSHTGGIPTPLFSGYFLKLADGMSFFLQSSDASAPLDILKQTGDIESIWSALATKTDAYWRAPNRPYLTWGAPRLHRWSVR